MNNAQALEYFKKTGPGDVFSWWDPEHDDRAHLYLWEIEKISDWLRQRSPVATKNTKVLEIAPGKGRVRSLLGAGHLKVFSKDVDYTTIEINRKMFNYSKARFKKEGFKVKSVLGDAHKLPFRKNTFDIVICVETFVHLPNLQQAVNEISRVLKPSGILISNIDLSTGLRRKLKNVFFAINSKINRKYEYRGSGIFMPYTTEGYRKTLSRGKFLILKEIFYGIFAPTEIEIYDKNHRIALINRFLSQKLLWFDKLLSRYKKLSPLNTYYLTLSKNDKS